MITIALRNRTLSPVRLALKVIFSVVICHSYLFLYLGSINWIRLDQSSTRCLKLENRVIEFMMECAPYNLMTSEDCMFARRKFQPVLGLEKLLNRVQENMAKVTVKVVEHIARIPS